jgi:hypothetical protein
VLELRLRGTDKRHRLSLEVVRDLGDGRVRTRASGTVDPASTGGAPLANGVWDLFLRHRDPDAGADLTRRVGGESGTVSAPPPPPGLVGAKARPVIPYVTERDNLSIDAGGRTRDLVTAMQAHPATARAEASANGGLEVSVTLPLHVSQVVADGRLRVVSELPDGVEVSAPATARPADRPDRCVLETVLPAFGAGGRLAVAWTDAAASHLALGVVATQPVAAAGSGPL